MIICGLDECGRGPLAGPLVAAAVILDKPLEGLNDSKQLTPVKREKLYDQILQTATVVEVSSISVDQINSKGIGWANKEAFRKLIKKIEAAEYVVDGNLKIEMRSKKIVSIVRADGKFPQVMAASIVAKVTRDRLMHKLAKFHPHYGWHTNVGYGTQKHILALIQFGPTTHHRKLFIKTALSTYSSF